jgi:spore germination protein GerM
MKHFFIFLGAFLIIIILAVFNLSLMFGENELLFQGDQSLAQWSPMQYRIRTNLGNGTAVSAPIATSSVPAVADMAAEIKIDSPSSNQVVSSPLEISGQAKGSWYFEAVFPIKLIDENGQVIAQGQAKAQSDWTSPNFVPFKAELNFDAGSSTIGMLVFSNDNPSGLPQNEKQFGVPVRFSDAEQMPVKIYFGNSQLSKNSSDCSLVFPAQRIMTKTQTTARAALELLLAGTSANEETDGYASAIDPGVSINSLSISSGTAKVDFSAAMEGQLGSDCRGLEARAQITQTLEQFSSVKNVIISVNGNIE